MRTQQERDEHKSAVQQHMIDMRQGDRTRGQADLAAHVEGLPGGTVRGLDRNAYAAFKQKLVSTLRRA